MPSKSLLMLCPDLPYPLTEGTRLDLWGRLHFFHREGWKVELVICPTPEKAIKISQAEKMEWPIPFKKTVIPRRRRWSPLESAKTISEVQRHVNRLQPRVLWCEYAELSSLVSQLRLRDARIWFRPHNFELAHAWDRAFGCGPARSFQWIGGLVRKQFAAPWIFAAEWRMHRLADRLFFISDADKRVMSALYGGVCRKDWLLPFLEGSCVMVKENKSPLDVFYLGSDYQDPLHRAGARKLLFEIIPAVEKAIPKGFRFHFVGKGGRGEFGRYATPHILIHDFVDNLSAFLGGMDIACFPGEIGWGCKIKMIEALASGLPTLGSRVTFRGVPATPEAYYECHRVNDYVSAFKKLQDPGVRRQLGERGKKAYGVWRSQAEEMLREALRQVYSSP